MKLVNDMVNGIRTIKSYGWETHYLNKITEVRKEQRTEIMKANALQAVGFSVYQQFGFVAVFAIFMYEWMNGNEIKMEEAFTLLAMIFYLFIQINNFMYWGFSAGYTMLAVLERLSQVLMMEEIVKEREDVDIKHEDVCIDIKDGAYTWGFLAEQENKVSETSRKLK